MRQQHKHEHRFLEEPVAWLFTGVKPGERRQFASVDDSVSQTWPTDNGFTWTIEPLYLSRMPIPEGWQLVPKEPTVNMLTALLTTYVDEGIPYGYEAMLAAAPKLEDV